MGKKRTTRLEDEARYEKTQRMVEERIAYHTAKAEEEEARAAAEAEKRSA